MYLFSLFTRILLYLPGEISHNLALGGLKLLFLTGLLKFFKVNNNQEINFSDRDLKKLSRKIGIAAGLDKNGDYIDCLAALGVSFIELGTVTPKPQIGNRKPRIFKNIKKEYLINRMGFNNKGVDYLVKNLKSKKTNIIVGSSIGKNFDTPNDKASADYLYCLERVYQHSDYVAVNISSPNTKDLRELSKIQYLDDLLQKLKSSQVFLSKEHGYKPIFVKISPDESAQNLKNICDSILKNNLDGIICCNTTIDHNNDEEGGLSGRPLKIRATSTLKQVKSFIGNRIPIIASGGVMTVADYQEKLNSGADLVQIYSGFIFKGPKLIQDILNLRSN